MDALFSPSRNTFFNPEWMDQYEAAGSWPSDGVEVSEAIFLEFGIGIPPEGKVRGVDADGLPVWVDAPQPSDEELAMAARQQRDALLRDSDWTQLGDVPEETKARWTVYRTALREIGQQEGFPRGIVWPEWPAIEA